VSHLTLLRRLCRPRPHFSRRGRTPLALNSSSKPILIYWVVVGGGVVKNGMNLCILNKGVVIYKIFNHIFYTCYYPVLCITTSKIYMIEYITYH